MLNPAVLGVQVADLEEKEMLLASDDGSKIFTEPHYNGYAAVLVRLEAIEVDELTELLTDAWRCQAPAALVEEFDARHELAASESRRETRRTTGALRRPEVGRSLPTRSKWARVMGEALHSPDSLRR